MQVWYVLHSVQNGVMIKTKTEKFDLANINIGRLYMYCRSNMSVGLFICYIMLHLIRIRRN